MSDTRPTPETDNETAHKQDAYEFINPPEWEWVVPSDFARNLERQRDEALQKSEIWAKQVSEAIRQVEASDTLYRKQCRQLEAMREAIKEARELLLSLEYEGNEKSTRCILCGSHCWEPHKEGCNMLSALAKLKPFLKP